MKTVGLIVLCALAPNSFAGKPIPFGEHLFIGSNSNSRKCIDLK